LGDPFNFGDAFNFKVFEIGENETRCSSAVAGVLGVAAAVGRARDHTRTRYDRSFATALFCAG
jgi:hypothetical protein